MELIWSTATFRPSNSKTWSASVVWFSNAMWYWKPEQPPPTTATRSATGTGLCMLMISLTLVLATGVKLIINPLASARGRTREAINNYIIPELANTRATPRSCLETSGITAFRQAWTLRIQLRCNDQTQSSPYSRRRYRAGSSRCDLPHLGSYRCTNRLGRDCRPLGQLRRPGKKRQSGSRGIRAQESRCAQRPHGYGHRRRRTQCERRATQNARPLRQFAPSEECSRRQITLRKRGPDSRPRKHRGSVFRPRARSRPGRSREPENHYREGFHTDCEICV